MKSKALFFFCLLFCLPMFGQEQVGSYSSDYWKKSFQVLATVNKSGNLDDIYVEVEAKSSRLAAIYFDAKDLNTFVTALREMKAKHIEWTKVAADNNVTKMDKDYTIKFPKITVAWYGTKWWFAFNERMTFTFRVTEAGKCISFWNQKVTSSSNEYIDETVYMAFGSEEDFDELINALDENKMLENLKKKDSQQDLFN